MTHCRAHLRNVCGTIFGRSPTLHRIPFGPLRGKFLFMSCALAPRMYFGINEPDIVRLARTYARPGGIIYDVGAHIGFTTLLFADCLRGRGEVHSFEIAPSVARKYLRNTIAGNRLTNVFVHEVGLGNDHRIVDLHVGATAMASLYSPPAEGDTEACTVVRLDDFATEKNLPAPTVIKIDVEGAELDCLMGGIETIRTHQPVMLIEFHSPDLLEQGVRLLRHLAYSLSTRTRDPLTESFIGGLTRFEETVLCIPKRLVGTSQKHWP